MKIRVTTTLVVNVPGVATGARNIARDRVTNALKRMVDPMNSGIAIVEASIDKVEAASPADNYISVAAE